VPEANSGDPPASLWLAPANLSEQDVGLSKVDAERRVYRERGFKRQAGAFT
jgi:hypothetical protein